MYISDKIKVLKLIKIIFNLIHKLKEILFNLLILEKKKILYKVQLSIIIKIKMNKEIEEKLKILEILKLMNMNLKLMKKEI